MPTALRRVDEFISQSDEYPGTDEESALATLPGRIAIATNQDIYLMDPDGANLERITPSGGRYSAMSWSPDGNRLVYGRFERGIWVAAADGSDSTLLEADGSEPAWSPDGTRIAFEITEDTTDPASATVYTIAADGSDRTRIGPGAAPIWSPTGDRIAVLQYAGERENNLPVFDLVVMDVDGTNPVRLTSDAGWIRGPAWSPDGSQIAYELWDTASPGIVDIWRIGIDGSNPELLIDPRWIGVSPTWSPDGNHLAYVDRIGTETGADIAVVVFDLNTGTTTSLANVTASLAPNAIAWSPDQP